MPLAVCVYSGARMGVNPEIVSVVEEIGRQIGAHGWHLICGGTQAGLMSVVGSNAMQNGSRVTVIIPQGLLEIEGVGDAHELIITQTMRERKGLLEARADAFLALPGGWGTLEELIEVLDLRLLGYHNKPIIIFNYDNFYTPLLDYFEVAVAKGFLNERQRSIYEVATTAEEAIALLEQAAQQAAVAPEE